MNQIINDAECGVIGGILMYPEEAVTELDGITSKDFSLAQYGKIFDIAVNAVRENPNTDGAVILSRIQSVDKPLATVAMRCMELFIGMAGFPSYVRIVKKESRKRTVNARLEEILLSGSDDPYADLEKVISECAEPEKSTMASSIVKYIDNLYHPEKVKRIFTGLSGLDGTIGGLKQGTLSYVGARPSTGKTAFALNVIKRQIKDKKKSLLFSLEMSKDQIFDRIVSDAMNISYTDIELCSVNDKQKEDIIRALGAINDTNRLEIVDDIYTIEGMLPKIASYQPDFVVVDYMQVIKTMKRLQTRRNEIDYISSELKMAAKRYNCHVMCLSQIGRAGMDAPRMSDLKESGALEQDGDYIMLLHRPYVLCKDNPSVRPEDAQILLDKNKYGRTGMKNLHFDGEHQRFTEVLNRG